MREVQDRGGDITPRFIEMIDSCIQCRGCETACPSSVPYGRLIETTIVSLNDKGHSTSPRWLVSALRPLGSRHLLALGSSVLGIAQRLGLQTQRWGVPPLPLRRQPLRATGRDVYLHTGCVMDAWYRPVHQAVIDVLGAMNLGARLAERGGDCCGALHHHAGDLNTARKLAARTMRAFPGAAPILVDSAGCGAALKEYGELLGTAEAEDFAARVYDVHEYVELHADRLPTPPAKAPWSGRVVIQDPCHLRHAQRAHDSVQRLLSRFGSVDMLDDEGMCCGSGGSFSLQHPELAREVRDRKHQSIQRSGASIVASANPGCAGFLQPEGATTQHPMILLAQALGLREPT